MLRNRNRLDRRIPVKYRLHALYFRREIARAWTFTCCGKRRLPFFAFYVKKEWNPWLAYFELFNNIFAIIITIANFITTPVIVAILGFFSILFGQCLAQLWYGYRRYQNPLQIYIANKLTDKDYSEQLEAKKHHFDSIRDLMEVLHCGRLDQSPQHGVRILGFAIRVANDIILAVVALLAALVLLFMFLLDKCVIFCRKKLQERKERKSERSNLTADSSTADDEDREDDEDDEDNSAHSSAASGDNCRRTAADQQGDVEIPSRNSSSSGEDSYADNEGVEVNSEGNVTSTNEQDTGTDEDEEVHDEDNLIAATEGLSIFCLDADKIVDLSFKCSGYLAPIGGSLLWACLYASYDWTILNRPDVGSAHSAILLTLKGIATSMMLFNEEYYTALLFRKNALSMFCAFLDLDVGCWITDMMELDEDMFEDVFDNAFVDDIQDYNAILARNENYIRNGGRRPEDELREELEGDVNGDIEQPSAVHLERQVNPSVDVDAERNRERHNHPLQQDNADSDQEDVADANESPQPRRRDRGTCRSQQNDYDGDDAHNNEADVLTQPSNQNRRSQHGRQDANTNDGDKDENDEGSNDHDDDNDEASA